MVNNYGPKWDWNVGSGGVDRKVVLGSGIGKWDLGVGDLELGSGGPLEDPRSLTSIKQEDLVDYLTRNGPEARRIPYASRNPTSPLNDLEAPP